MRNTTWKRIGLMAVLTLLFFVRPTTDASARRMSPVSPSQGEPSFLYALQDDERYRQWVDSVMHTLSLKERIGQLFVYTIAPTQTKANVELLRKVVKHTRWAACSSRPEACPVRWPSPTWPRNGPTSP